MPEFDVTTLLQIGAVINAGVALVWCLLAGVFRIAPAASWLLAAAHFCVLLTPNGGPGGPRFVPMPDWLHRTAAVLAVTLLALGVRRLMRLRMRSPDIAVIGTLGMLLTAFFGLQQGGGGPPMPIGAICVCMLCLLCSRDVALGAGPGQNRAATTALMLPYLMMMLMSGGRVLALSGLMDVPSFMNGGSYGPLVGWFWIMFSLGVPLSLITVVIRRLIQRFEHLTLRDTLTGLINRRAIADELTRLARLLQRQQAYCVLMMDVDHFKRINDAHGHAAGDAALRHLVSVLKRCTREADVLGRLGGEEFCVLLPRTELAAACRVAERMRAHLEDAAFIWKELPITMTMSIGVASGVPEDPSGEAMLAEADAQMYRAKAQGRNRVCAAPSNAPGPAATWVHA